MGTCGVRDGDQKRVQLQVSCSPASPILSARSVVGMGVRTGTSRAGCWPELPRKQNELIFFVSHSC